MIVEDTLWYVRAHNCLVCIKCVDGSVVNYAHLAHHMKNHDIRVDASFTQKLSMVSHSLSFATPEEVYKELRDNTKNAPIPGLRIHEGYTCVDCPYASITLGSMRTHKSKPNKDSQPHQAKELQPAKVQQLAQRHNAPLFVVQMPSTAFLHCCVVTVCICVCVCFAGSEGNDMLTGPLDPAAEDLVSRMMADFHSDGSAKGSSSTTSVLDKKLFISWLYQEYQFSDKAEIGDLTKLSFEGMCISGSSILSVCACVVCVDEALIRATQGFFQRGQELISNTSIFWLKRLYSHSPG